MGPSKSNYVFSGKVNNLFTLKLHYATRFIGGLMLTSENLGTRQTFTLNMDFILSYEANNVLY